ncbi:phosphinothricin acetyltransferase [Bradyrhizobium sp. Ghvi]|uniref:GNAT family N-acetyltransferase n=1 Tax=Bradyrhizobium sp. Ghvi TaxID=1855319 RepID=UPI0008EDAFCA|nr:GNAT family N-acetyltransferase [Bradyrhizobium sp. Ghvi]SFQ37276.1 phosphinothricin acetyltransferase [Bradyrhizobium sp. Ghvi]
MLRLATYADVDDIVRIYNQALKPGIFATSQVAPDTSDERIAWLREHQDAYPAFVYEIENDKVIGWCSLSRSSVRPEYSGVAETSHYVDEGHQGKGIGNLMLAHLIETATKLGFRLLVSRVLERNLRSAKGAASLGFQRAVLLHEALRIRGEWHNDVWIWKKL